MKYALIVGAGSDMAYATAKEFAENGYGLYLTARNEEQLDVLKKDLQARYDVPVKAFVLDITAYDSHKGVLAELEPFPVACACFVGYLGEQPKAEVDFEEARKIIEVNYLGPVRLLNLMAEQYEKMGEGNILGVSSVAGERGRQSNYFYGSAKAGFTAYLSGLRNRLYRHGVQVTTIKPGFVNTKMTQELELPKLLTAEASEVGKAIFNAFKKNKDVIYVRPVWWLIMKNIKLIPEPVFKRMKL